MGILWQKMSEYRSVVRRKRSGGWEESDRCSYAVREKSIDFLKILYRFVRMQKQRTQIGNGYAT